MWSLLSSLDISRVLKTGLLVPFVVKALRSEAGKCCIYLGTVVVLLPSNLCYGPAGN